MKGRTLKILQVVTVVTPQNAYGGPLRVAINQTRELRRLGHEVTLIAGANGYKKEFPITIDGVVVRLFPAHKVIPWAGFAGLTSPGLLAFVMKNAHKFDVLHAHLARDLVVAPPTAVAGLKKVPLVVQPHGMIDESSRALAGLFDKLFLEAAFRRAKSVLCLTDEEKKSLTSIFGHGLNVEILINGVPQPAEGFEPGCGSSSTVSVLYLARLHKRKRPMSFVRAAQNILRRGVDAQFVLVGADEGEGASVVGEVQKYGEKIRWLGGMPSGETDEVMVKSDMYCLPSVNEPFPMSVLEAMARGLPVVITKSCGLARYIEQGSAGIVVSEDENALEDALLLLIKNPELRRQMGRKARAMAESVFSMRAVGEQLEEIYTKAAIAT